MISIEGIRQALKDATWTDEQIDKLRSTPQIGTEQGRGKEYDAKISLDYFFVHDILLSYRRKFVSSKADFIGL